MFAALSKKFDNLINLITESHQIVQEITQIYPGLTVSNSEDINKLDMSTIATSKWYFPKKTVAASWTRSNFHPPKNRSLQIMLSHVLPTCNSKHFDVPNCNLFIAVLLLMYVFIIVVLRPQVEIVKRSWTKHSGGIGTVSL